MSVLDEYRAKYPQYNSVSDSALAAGIYKKHYAGQMSEGDFLAKVFPAPDIKAAEDKAVQGVADSFGRDNAGMTQMVPGLGELKRMLVGAGETVRTAAPRILQATGKYGPQPTPEDMAQIQSERDMTSKMGGLSANLGRGVPGLLGAGTPSGYVPQMLAGAAQGALTGENPLSGAAGGVAGGAIGTFAGNMLGRAANALSGKWGERAVQGADDASQALKKFQAEGGVLTPAQASGGANMASLEDKLANNLLTSSAYRSMEKQNRQHVTDLTAEALGVKSSDLGPTALRAADDVISKEFDNVASMVPRVPVSKYADDIRAMLRKGDVKPIESALQKGTISGQQYMDVRSKLLALTRGSSDKVDDAWNLIDDLDSAVENVAPAEFKPAYAAARERYKTLLTVEKFKRGISGGQANAATLDSAAQSIFRKQYTRDGSTLLPETKKFFNAIRAMADPRMASKFGGSQTAPRSFGMVDALAGGGGVAAMMGHPAALAAAGAVGGGIPMMLAAPAAPQFGQLGGLAGRQIGSEDLAALIDRLTNGR